MNTGTLNVQDLEAAALAWVGTPYADNGCTRGVAASCHGLVWALYREAGWDHGMPLGDGPSRWAGNREGSPLCVFMRSQADKFIEVHPFAAVSPGDLLGFRIGADVKHAALMLPGGQMVHALRRYGVQIRPFDEPSWICRLAKIWRPRVSFINYQP